jgi:hypothetical protein
MTPPQGNHWSQVEGGYAARSRSLSFTCAPARGLVNVRHEPSGVVFPLLLGVEIVDARGLGPKPLAEADAPPEVVLRQDVLLAMYKPTANRPVECHARWRIGLDDVVDLEVSALTPGKWAGLTVRTSSALPPGETTTGLPAAPLVCLHRLAGAPITYVEMCHPHDGIALEAAADGAHRFHLFGHDLEKGVILRGRLRGILLPRAGDEAAARQAYEAFLKQPANLS